MKMAAHVARLSGRPGFDLRAEARPFFGNLAFWSLRRKMRIKIACADAAIVAAFAPV